MQQRQRYEKFISSVDCESALVQRIRTETIATIVHKIDKMFAVYRI